MIKGGFGGGNTVTGLHFETRTDLRQLFEEIEGYELRDTGIDRCGYQILFNGELLAYCFKKKSYIGFYLKNHIILTGETIFLNN